MKKIMLWMIMFGLTIPVFSQKNTGKVALTSSDYLTKSKNQKTGAWILLGGGLVLIGAGILSATSGDPTLDDATSGFGIGIIGGLSTLGSIPLFLASSRNKKKAAKVSVFYHWEQKSIFYQKASALHRGYPALGFKVTL